MRALTAATFRRRARDLATRDPALGRVVASYGLPRFWERPATFATLVLFIIEQQVSLASAKATFDRLGAAIGGITPQRLLGANDDAFAVAGLSRQKRRYVLALADAAVQGVVDLDALAGQPDAEARHTLLGLLGVGPWTADVYLLSALRRPDVWPSGDRALQVGVGEVLGLDGAPDVDQTDHIGERWRPSRSVAARLIWHSYLCRRGRTETIVAGLEP
jgi:DNA-3-methyladenine glycosylase II